MKKLILVLLVLMYSLTFQAKAQRIMSLQLQGYYGIGNIFYTNGFYQGQVYNGVAHGSGTFYFRDGTIFRGNFFDGWRNGPGVLIVPYRGYVTGCWNMGNFTGPVCNTTKTRLPNYNSSNQVRQVVDDTYDDFPEDANFQASNPDNYNIVQINSDTQLGRTLLGKYSGN